MIKKITDQEKFWKGKFGDEYISRANTNELYRSDIKLFKDVFKFTGKIRNTLEFGCNIGLNLKAIKKINKDCLLTGIEINKNAVLEAKKIKNANIIQDSIYNVSLKKKFDLVFTKGVLIHLNPKKINEAYKKIYCHSNKYILLAEYYNPNPIEINYRGNKGKLFKRDFAGDMLKKYSDLRLVSYSFMYRYDTKFPSDDFTWFLLKKIK